MQFLTKIETPSFSSLKKLQCGRHRLKWYSDLQVGTVESFDIEHCEPPDYLHNFFRTLKAFGYKPRSCATYSSLSLTSCRGSVEPHIDSGYGLVALWLVKTEPLFRGKSGVCFFEQPMLYSGRKWSAITKGGVVVFDADKDHAWLSNFTCHMIMQTVSRARPKAGSLLT